MKAALWSAFWSILITIVVCTWFMAHAFAAGGRCTGQEGLASWYGPESGGITASGAVFRPDGLSAAMPSRAMLGRRVVVTDMATGRSLSVLVNDIGPAARLHRSIDLSRGAARRLGILRRGVARVCVTVVGR